MDSKENPQLDIKGSTPSDDMDDSSIDYSDPTGILVKPKWRGTNQDKLDMSALGRHQPNQRNFRFLSIFGFGSTLICTWEILLAFATPKSRFHLQSTNEGGRNILFVTIDGGTANLFWGYIVVFLGMGSTYFSLAEMASILNALPWNPAQFALHS
ncbi:MAG: hypothetical protein Q9169_007653 [Polycauliona sp. 2 TL-2023]